VFNPQSGEEASLYVCFQIGKCGSARPLVGLKMGDIGPLGFFI
jgi:hypothetical protein